MAAARPLLCTLAVAALSGCPEAEALVAFDVELTTQSDCSQVASNAVQCEDEETVRDVVRRGRWVIEDKGGGFFSLTSETGRILTGLSFANDGATANTESCNGEGGTCYYGRTRTDATDPESGCLRSDERSIDVRVDEDRLVGLTSDVLVTEEDCGTPQISQTLIEVRGVRAEEPIYAREELGDAP